MMLHTFAVARRFAHWTTRCVAVGARRRVVLAGKPLAIGLPVPRPQSRSSAGEVPGPTAEPAVERIGGVGLALLKLGYVTYLSTCM